MSKESYGSGMRLLLPFTHGVDAHALTHAFIFAKATQATVVAVALIPLPHQEGAKGPRLERIQQAKDFLEFMCAKADVFHVALERHEIFTKDVVAQITHSVQQLRCQGLLLVWCERETRFSLVDEAEQLVQQTLPFPLYIVRSIPEKGSVKRLSLLHRLVSWLSQWKNSPMLIPLLAEAEEGKSVKKDYVQNSAEASSSRR